MRRRLIDGSLDRNIARHENAAVIAAFFIGLRHQPSFPSELGRRRASTCNRFDFNEINRESTRSQRRTS
ncbi:hypothetical protein LC55x_1728 [Lysobacter capsici]|nr:hypothetical protein LC55x_1728 [Lysobacter capsici]